MADHRIDTITALREVVVYGLFDGGGFGLREVREDMEKSGLSVPLAMDEEILESVLFDDLAELLFVDDDTQPFSHWWWHLGKIRDKTFPAEQLPAHLREVYLESEKIRSM
ncbi:hypothetical protein [Methylotuvimicrobium sp. KM1]|uniref:hypothetical protein n=1 Tax=Methylotuvimicrobium sp. KM1 TaxID=3377707 RepID=UPI00384E524B